jgi:hypothetical protein
MVGWIKLSRCISEHWIFQDALKFKWWVLIILNVNYKDSKFLLGSKVYDVKRGSSTNSLRKWALILNTGVKSVSSYLELLEKEGMITKEIIGKGKQSTTLINIINYTKYQSLEETQGGTLEGTLKGTQRKREGHTEEESKESKEGNKERKEYLANADRDLKFISKYIKDKRPTFLEPYVECWNMFAEKYGKPKIIQLSKSRGNKLKVRLNNQDFVFPEILYKVKDQTFPMQNNFLTFDWIIENDKNYLKILEGNFKDKPKQETTITLNRYKQ